MNNRDALVPYAAPSTIAPMKFNPKIQRQLSVSQVKLLAAQNLLTLTTQAHTQTKDAMLAASAAGYQRTEQLIAQSVLPEDLAAMHRAVNHNSTVSILNQIEGVDKLYEHMLKESLKVLLVPDHDWEPRTVGQRLKAIWTAGESELERKYGVRLPWWQSLLNGASFGAVADARLRELDNLMGNGYGYSPK